MIFEGRGWTTTENWLNVMNLDEYKNRPINYLEIGVYFGKNIISVADSYCSQIVKYTV